MDTSTVVIMEESRQKSDSPISASKSLGALIKINSIAIDITSAVEEVESPTHDHFSIRGFVAGMRNKDRNICLPFASEGSDVDNLPPIDVPRFQWWQCPNCVPDIAMKRSREESSVAGRSDVGTSSCKNVGGEKDSLLYIKDNIGNNICSGDHIADDDDNYLSKTIKHSNPCCNEGHNSTTSFPDDNLDINTEGSKDKADGGDKEALNPCAMSEPNKFQTRERLNGIAVRPSCIVGDPEIASSGATFNALPYRRKPKLRSLADIMVVEKNSTSDNPRTRSASSGGMQVSSTDNEADLDPQLQLNIPSDAAKVTSRSPQRKRKMVLEEERGPLARKNRSLMLHAERKCRRVENSESESDRNAQARLDLQLRARTERIKPKSNKVLDISKKMRQSHTEDRAGSVTEQPKINGPCSVNAVSKDKCFGQSGDAPSTTGETGLCFRSFLSGQKADRISNLSKGKMAEAEADHVTMMQIGKGILGNCKTNGKVALDLSLNSFVDVDAEMNSESSASFVQYRGIPDLNEEFPQKTAMMHVDQLTSHSEKRILPLDKSLFFQDTFASCSKETTREGKRHVGISKPQNKDNNTTEFGASDDIPMEIVELLARNQHERALGNSRKHLLPEGINNSSRGCPALYADRFPGMINFPLASRNGLTVENGNMGVRQKSPINLTQLNNYQTGMSKPEESRFGFFRSSTTTSQQMKTHYSAPSPVITGTRPSTGADLLWSPTRENVPFHLSIPQRHSVQTNRNGVSPYSDLSHRGKTVGDNIKVGKGKKAVRDTSVFKEGRIPSSSTSIRTLDPYSNDTIPAMQLLSLMDQRIVSSPSFEAGPKRFLDNHQRQVNGKENQNFLGGSFFSQNSRSKEFSGLSYGVYCSGESSKTASPYVLSQRNQELGNSKATPLEGSGNIVIRQSRSSLELGTCTLNRNPADFSIPDSRNEFTLSAKDFKSRKRNGSKEKPRSMNVEGEKRRRTKKDASQEKNAQRK